MVSVSKADSEQPNYAVEAIPEGRELQYASVANVMGTVLSSLRLQDVEPRTDTDVPVTVTEWATFDGLAITAESFERDDDPWVAFRVEYRPAEEAPSEDAEPDAASEAMELDRRLAGWRYRVAGYQHDQMTRRMDDLLQDLPEDSEAGE